MCLRQPQPFEQRVAPACVRDAPRHGVICWCRRCHPSIQEAMVHKYGSQIVYLSPITHGRLNRFCSIPSGSSGTKRVLRARLLASCGRRTCHYLSLIEAAAQADPLVFDFIASAGEFLGIRSQEVGSMITGARCIGDGRTTRRTTSGIRGEPRSRIRAWRNRIFGSARM